MEHHIDAWLKERKDKTPDSAPFVLSYRNLNFSNIMVYDRQLEVNLDWDDAGYHPWWVEMYKTSHKLLYPKTPMQAFWKRVWGHLYPKMNEEDMKENRRWYNWGWIFLPA